MNKKRLFFGGFVFLFIVSAHNAFAQSDAVLRDNPSALIGMTLTELINRFGVPNQVFPVRGVEPWQDDVVFVYTHGEFFIVGDRVWQIALRAAYNIRIGDTRAAVNTALGEGRDFDGFSLYQLPVGNWPLTLRVNWNAAGRVGGIYLYRSDF